jgi:Tfp pilus assembly protein PilP
MELLITYGLRWVLETGFLLLALWIMVKIQKLQFNFPGLLIAAAIASAFNLIPFVGRFIAVPVLWMSLTKVTREDFAGVAFTTGVSYALVFGMNLFLLGALMGHLTPSTYVRARTLPDNRQQTELTSDDEDNDSVATRPEASAPTNTPNTVPPAKASGGPAQTAAVQPENPSSDLPLNKAFFLKGVTQNGKNSMALISTGGKTYTVFLNETVSVDTGVGKKTIRLEKVDKNLVLLDVEGQVIQVKDAPPQ